MMQLGGSSIASVEFGDIARGGDPTLVEEDQDTDDGLKSAERAAIQMVDEVYTDSKRFMARKRKNWVRHYERYRALFVDEKEDGPLKSLNPPKMAKILDLFVARVMQLTIPDKQRLDFINLTPDPTAEPVFTEEVLAQYAELATVAVREDLRKAEFVKLYRRMLLDLAVTGNMLALSTYDYRVQYRFVRKPNPEYDPGLPEEFNVEFMPDGTKIPIRAETVEREPYYEADRPEVRYLNPLNVFPSEPDQHNYADCQAVVIFDKVNLEELEDDAIENGGFLFANLKELRDKADSMTSHVDNLDTESSSDRGSMNVRPKNRASLGLGRKTYLGRLNIDDLFRSGSDKEVNEAAKARAVKKFRIEREKLKHWKTWVVEVVEGVVIRLQPLPHFSDRIPIRHYGLYPTPNNTVAEGNYDRAEKHEKIHNLYQRLAIEGTLRMVRPMWGVVRQFIDPLYWQECEGRISYSPDKVVPLTPAAGNINNALSSLRVDPQVLHSLQSGQLNEERTMSELTHFPAIKQGQASGGNTATEVAAMSQNADVMMEEIAQAIEMEFLNPLMGDILDLHHQYSDEPKVVNELDKSGDLKVFNIPPEVWLRRYHVNLMGYRQTGNAAVKAQMFEKFFGLLERTGRANWDAIAPEFGRLLQLPFAERFLSEPPPPAPPEVKTSVSIPLKAELLPASVQAKVLLHSGIELTPEEMGEMGVLLDNAEMAKALQAAGGGSDGSGRGNRPSEAGNGRDHHAPGEYTPGRGLGDAVGIQKSIGQMNRNPAAGRAANAI